MQKLFGIRGQNDLFGIEQTAFEESAPDAIPVLIINGVRAGASPALL